MSKKLLEKGQEKMQTLVDQHNELLKEIQSLTGRLEEVRTAIIKQQGYLEALGDVDVKK